MQAISTAVPASPHRGRGSGHSYLKLPDQKDSGRLAHILKSRFRRYERSLPQQTLDARCLVRHPHKMGLKPREVRRCTNRSGRRVGRVRGCSSPTVVLFRTRTVTSGWVGMSTHRFEYPARSRSGDRYRSRNSLLIDSQAWRNDFPSPTMIEVLAPVSCEIVSRVSASTSSSPPPRAPKVDGLSMGETTRRLNAEGTQPASKVPVGERSVASAVLRNPAYRGRFP
jgi:hypothetical protein